MRDEDLGIIGGGLAATGREYILSPRGGSRKVEVGEVVLLDAMNNLILGRHQEHKNFQGLPDGSENTP